MWLLRGACFLTNTAVEAEVDDDEVEEAEAEEEEEEEEETPPPPPPLLSLASATVGRLLIFVWVEANNSCNFSCSLSNDTFWSKMASSCSFCRSAASCATSFAVGGLTTAALRVCCIARRDSVAYCSAFKSSFSTNTLYLLGQRIRLRNRVRTKRSMKRTGMGGKEVVSCTCLTHVKYRRSSIT